MWLRFLNMIRWISYSVCAALLMFGLIVLCFSDSARQGWIFMALGLIGVITQLGIRYEVRKGANDVKDTVG